MDTDREEVIDHMIEFAIEELLSGESDRKRAMVRRMAQKWPDVPALSIVFAVTSATGMIEDEFRQTNDPVVPLGYRLAALVSADIHAIQSMGRVPSVAQDLLHFWRRVDPMYLRLA